MSLKTADEVIETFKLLVDKDKFFRGYSDYEYHMKPTLGRGNYDEFQILHNYYKANRNNTAFSAFIDLIEHAQHYNEKTRLLDWSSNPWVTLYFANACDKDNDNQTYIALLDTQMPGFDNIPKVPITLSMIDEFTLAELDEFTLNELETFGLNSTTKYIANSRFKSIYQEFINGLPVDKYLINRYSIKGNNQRKDLQEGLFTFHKDYRKPLAEKYFEKYTLDLPSEEKMKLLEILSSDYGINKEGLGFGE